MPKVLAGPSNSCIVHEETRSKNVISLPPEPPFPPTPDEDKYTQSGK